MYCHFLARFSTTGGKLYRGAFLMESWTSLKLIAGTSSSEVTLTPLASQNLVYRNTCGGFSNVRECGKEEGGGVGGGLVSELVLRCTRMCRRYRVISSEQFLEHFASNRSHMRTEDGLWHANPPCYPCIRSKGGLLCAHLIRLSMNSLNFSAECCAKM